MPARSMTKGGIEGVGCLRAAVSGEGEICSNGGWKSFANKGKEMIIESNGSTKKRPSTMDFHCSDGSSSSSSSSSIGKNSDVYEESGEKPVGDEEVQSSCKGPLDAMEALVQVLPIRRGISRFYIGKSKSFASLADASPSSLAKPENAYMRKRRNLLACSLAYDHPRTRGNNGGGISKRAAANAGNKTTLALAVAMNKASGQDKQPLRMASASSMKDFSSWRSFSMVDLQQN